MRTALRAVPVLLVLASLTLLFAPRRAVTLPLYAARTGLKCQNCHFDPNGGGPRNDFGFMFARNRSPDVAARSIRKIAFKRSGFSLRMPAAFTESRE